MKIRKRRCSRWKIDEEQNEGGERDGGGMKERTEVEMRREMEEGMDEEIRAIADGMEEMEDKEENFKNVNRL